MGPRADGSTRTINLTETEISDAIIDRLRETPTPGMQFHFGRRAAVVDERSFNGLDRALLFWGNIAQGRP